MAGSYVDYPGHRMAIDADGSTIVMIDETNAITDVTASAATINDESTGSVGWYTLGQAGTQRVAVIFPELRDLTGYFFAVGGDDGAYVVAWSADTTTGLDGSWTTLSSDAAITAGAVSPGYRNAIISASVSGAKALRVSVTVSDTESDGVRAFHVFGQPTSAGDYLELWDPSLSQRVGAAHFDWGDVPRSSTADVTFRVKNTSGTLTADDIVISTEATSDTTPSVPAQHTISQGGSYAATQDIGSLAPGAVSGTITLRRTTPSDATLGLWALRVKAEAGSWS